MKFRLGFLLGAATAAVIVTNMNASQRQRLRDTAGNMVSTVKSTVKSSDTAEQISDVVSRADEATADAIADISA